MSKQAILCVDDEIFILESLERQLYKAFKNTYVYEFAESADEGLDIIKELKKNHVDIVVVISDWLMPGIRGDEFMIRVHRQLPDALKIILTGQADELAIERATKEANLYRCLQKPWRSEELIEIINSGIGK
jgi:CheY-like chemotaxis protein